MHKILTVDPNLLGAGLNNQKLVLLGLCQFAIEEKSFVLTPAKCVDFNAFGNGQGLIPTDLVLDVKLFEGFLSRWNLLPPKSIQDYSFLSCKKCFNKGVAFLQQNVSQLLDSDFVCDFFASLQTTDELNETMYNVLNCIQREDEGALALQLRIEKDWVRHVDKKLARNVVGFAHYKLEDILSKILNHLPLKETKVIFACCDEEQLPVEVDTLKRIACNDFGIELIFRKNDLGIYFENSSIKNAITDFQVCKSIDSYVGISQSSFSNLICISKCIEHQKDVSSHYIYNTGGLLKVSPYSLQDIVFS